MNIYSGITTDFNNNGYGFLKDCKTASVTNATNGVYELNIEYPRNTDMDEYLIVGNIIKTNVGNNNYQLFRIKSVNKSFNPIQIYAQHIFYDLADNYIEDAYPQNLNCEAFGNWILDKTNFDTNFVVYSDITGTKTARYVDKNPVQCFLGDDANSLVNLFGCEIERDNFNITFKDRIGNDNGVKLVIGKNITSINIKIDISSLYTKIKPVGFNNLTLPETYVSSPLINNWPTPKICKYDFGNIKYDPNDPTAYQTEDEAYEALRDATEALFNSGIDKPQINIKINWVELSKTKEYYDKYNNIERVSLGDTVYAEIEGLNYKTRVIKTVYNVLTDSIDSYELGTVQPSYATTITSMSQSVEEINPTNILSQAQENATNQINSAMGGYVYKTNEELYIMDTDNPNTATKVWRWNLNGLGYSNNGINGPYETAITQDGAIVANFITTGKINTDVIEGYDQLVAKVNSEIGLTNEVSSLEYVELTNAYKANIIYFRIFGEMSLLFPRDDLYPSDDLYPLDSYLIIEDESGNQNKIHLPINYLHYYNENIYDEFIVEKDIAKIIRRVGENTDGTLYELENQTIEELGECIISLNSGYNKLWLESFYDKELNYYARYATINDYTDTFATKVEMNSAITQTADSINLEVSKKVDEDEVIAAINLTSEEAKINAGKITLEGIVTANENFKVLEDGSIEAVNGKFSGNVYLEDGNMVIGGDGILSTMIINATIWSLGFLGGNGFMPLGFEAISSVGSQYYQILDFTIPDNFKVQKAYIYLRHTPLVSKGYFNGGMNIETITGYSRNINAYICSDNSFYRTLYQGIGEKPEINGNYNKINNCFGANGFTGSSSGLTQTKSIDISNYFSNSGTYSIKLQCDCQTPVGLENIYANTGCVLAQLYIFGYTSQELN